MQYGLIYRLIHLISGINTEYEYRQDTYARWVSCAATRTCNLNSYGLSCLAASLCICTAFASQTVVIATSLAFVPRISVLAFSKPKWIHWIAQRGKIIGLLFLAGQLPNLNRCASRIAAQLLTEFWGSYVIIPKVMSADRMPRLVPKNHRGTIVLECYMSVGTALW